ncbi:MAG: hypothetical protein IPO40_17245 [Fibrobacteres bacterium]|nr:hypothetical protein [Fibrobacterota bacterium]
MKSPRELDHRLALLRSRLVRMIWMVGLVLAPLSFAWSPSLELDRTIWVRFDGKGLRIEDDIRCIPRIYQRFSVREPLHLESIDRITNLVSITSVDSGERGFPIGGVPNMYVESIVDGSPMQSIPLSPNGWRLSSAKVDVHLGPGWKLIAILGGGEGSGAWADEWTVFAVVAVLLFALVAALAFSRKVALLFLAGVVLAGAKSFPPTLLLLLAFGMGAGVIWRRWIPAWNFWGIILGGLFWMGCGVLILEYAGNVLDVVTNPSGLPGARSETWYGHAMNPLRSFQTLGLGLVDRSEDQFVAPKSLRTIRIPKSIPEMSLEDRLSAHGTEMDSIDTIVDQDYGRLSDWGRGDLDLPGSIGSVNGGMFPDCASPDDDLSSSCAWIPDEDSMRPRSAPVPPGISEWGPRTGTRSWELPENSEKSQRSPLSEDTLDAYGFPVDTGEDFPAAVEAGRSMRLVVLPPILAGAWQILSVILLSTGWFLASRKLARGNRFSPHSPIGSTGHVCILAILVLAGQAICSSPKGNGTIERRFQFSRETRITTSIERIEGDDTLLRVPLLPGEHPVDPLEIRDGYVVVHRVRPSPDARECWESVDSVKSGGWSGVVSHPPKSYCHKKATWTSSIRTDTSMLLRADPTGSWSEAWWIFHSERWDPRFEGLKANWSGHNAYERSLLFLPGPSDTLRIRLKATRTVADLPLRINQARLEFADPELSKARLDVRIMAPRHDTLRVVLPPDAQEVECWRNRRQVVLGPVNGRGVAIDVLPGKNAVRLQWRSPRQEGLFRRVPPVSLSAQGINASVRLPAPTRKWIPVLHGLGFGPAEDWLVWVIVFALAAVGLLLRFRLQNAWADLAAAWLGACFVSPLLVAAFPVLVFLHRPHDLTENDNNGSRWVMFQGRKWMVCGAAVLVGLCLRMAFLLHSDPPVVSMDGTLLWYTDFAGPDLMRPWMVVLPEWAWNVAVIGSMAWLVSLGVRLVRRNAVPSDA